MEFTNVAKSKAKLIIKIMLCVAFTYSSIVMIDIARVKKLQRPLFAFENGYMGSMVRFDGLGYRVGLDINATTGEVTYGQITGLGHHVIKAKNK